MDSFGFKILVLLVCSCTVSGQEQPLDVSIRGGNDKLVVMAGERNVQFTCAINRDFHFAISNRVVWLHEPSGTSEELKEKQLTVQGTLKEGRPEDYKVLFDIQSEQNTLLSTLTLLHVKEEQEGKFICRVMTSDDKFMDQYAEQELVVVNDVTSVELVFDKEEPVKTVEPNAVQTEEGEYIVRCRAAGFSPAVSFHIKLGNMSLETTPVRLAVDEAASAKALRYKASTQLRRPLDLTADKSDMMLSCSAKAQFPEANPRTASFPLQVIAMEPTIVCEKNVSHNVGDLYVRIPCVVDHSKIKVDRNRYAFETASGDKITYGNMTKGLDEVIVKALNATADSVTLELYELTDDHVKDSVGPNYFYIDVYSQSGQNFRQRAILFVKGTSGASKPAACVLALLISLLWSL